MPTPKKVVKYRSPVRKAKNAAEGMIAVYDVRGNLVGICDPDKITPVANAETKVPDAPADVPPSAEAVEKARQQLKKSFVQTGSAAEQGQIARTMTAVALSALQQPRKPPARRNGGRAR